MSLRPERTTNWKLFFFIAFAHHIILNLDFTFQQYNGTFGKLSAKFFILLYKADSTYVTGKVLKVEFAHRFSIRLASQNNEVGNMPNQRYFFTLRDF